MALQSTPDVARQYARGQRGEIRRLSRQAEALWRRVGDDFTAGFDRIAPALIEAMNTAQVRTVERATAYIPSILDATDNARADVPRFEIDQRQWVGTAGNGQPTETVAYDTVIRAKSAIANGASVTQAQASAGAYLATAMQTLVADTARGVEQASTYARPVSGYVRQLQGESCGRCIILAGKWYRKNAGFDRHPRCDCVGIPAAENIAGDMTTSPIAYLDSLDDRQLARALGSQDNALAYREYGADPNQIVNAYRKRGDVRTAQRFGTNVRYTTEGTTVRGVAYAQMSRVRAMSALARDGGRYRRLTEPRLMPASIFKIAQSQEHATRLLRDYGWLGYTRP